MDSLEYEIAKSFPNLRQTEFGKVIVPLTNDNEPYTPVVWGSFITGLPPSRHSIFEGPELKWDNRVLQKLRELLRRRGNSFYWKNYNWIGKLMTNIGFRMTPHHIFHTKEDFISKKISTIFDRAKKPIAMSVPSYNEEQVNQYLRGRLSDVYRDGLPQEVLEKEALKVFRSRKKELLRRLDEDWDLLMTHLFIVDTFGHLIPTYDPKFERVYTELNEMAGEIKDKMHNTFILIVSDHGHRNCSHTPYGFYSSNQIIGLHYPKITEFHQIILEMLSS